MPRYTIPFTQQGFNQIQKEYKDLLEKRPEIVKNLSIARDMGDRSENAAYKEARRKLSSTDSRLRFLKRLVEHGNVVRPSQNEYVEIGSTVFVHNGTQEITFYIVGEYEADPMQHKISFKSPVGKQLLGKKRKETIYLDLPSGKVQYTILDIQL